MNSRIQTLLGPTAEPGILDTWACMMTNYNRNLVFLGFGKSMHEAQSSSQNLCEKGSEGSFFCQKDSALCEQAQTNSMVWFCDVTNHSLNKSFSGKGRTKVEAMYNTQKSCENGSGGGFFCSNPDCTMNP